MKPYAAIPSVSVVFESLRCVANDESPTCLPSEERDEEEDDACDRRLADAAHGAAAHVVDVEAHHERDRDRRAHGEHAPRALRERHHDDVPEPRERDDDDEEDRDRGHQPERGPELLAGDLRERAAVAARARDEDDEVVDGAAEDDAEEDPQEARIEAELRREDGSDQRARRR